jgi:lipoprotein-anchoring transpeptidase ErfK/SrfK
MMRRPWSLLCALAIVLASAVFVPAASAAAASAEPAAEPPASAGTALVLTASPATITSGGATALTVHLGIAGATVRLSRKAAGDAEFTLIGTPATDALGELAYRAAPRVTTTYRAEFFGDAEWSPASSEATVTVRPRVRLVAPATVYRGDRVRLTVQVAPAHPGAAVTIEMWNGDAWAPWRDVTLDDGSRAALRWTADRAGHQAFRVSMAADEEHAAGASGARRVRIQKPNPYGVPLAAARIVVVDLSQYTMYFFSYGREVRSFPCVLGRPSLPTPRGHFRIYAKGMNPGGPYGARIMSYHSPCAIHGTNEPWLLRRFPRGFSHSCTRLSNANAIWLYDHAPIGTRVWNVP